MVVDIKDNLIPVLVPTPQGKKHHGNILDGAFVREVKQSKDLMRIFDAWSIHPGALKVLKEMGVKDVIYKDIENNKVYSTTISTIDTHGFLKTFAGGPTVYLPRKHWKGEE